VSFTAQDVMALRQKTGLGMMDCKKALTETDGDVAAAEQWLRDHKKGKMEARTERATGEGRIGIAIDGDNAVIVEVRTETDFTARNENFVQMVDDVTQAAMQQPAGDIVADDQITKRVDDLRITTGENVNFARGRKLVGGTFGQYVHHDGKRGVLLQVEGEAPDDLLKGLCQHIVFHDPLGISEEDVPADELEKIRAEAIAEAKESGKNDEIAEKIASGKVRKYLEERTLVNQKYILDESQAVKEILPANVTIKQFVRFTLGS
jgi:elongation factor Ts